MNRPTGNCGFATAIKAMEGKWIFFVNSERRLAGSAA